MKNSYLIPANSKKSLLIFGLFETIDAWIFAIGVGLSFLLMMFLPVSEFWVAIIAICPGLVCGLLVFPIPNYHNVRTVLANAWEFYTTRQRYIWRGWCLEDGEDTKR